MTKRSQWIMTCFVFTLFWAVLSLFLWFLIFPVFMVPVSLLMILVPVGVAERPERKHNPSAWENKR